MNTVIGFLFIYLSYWVNSVLLLLLSSGESQRQNESRFFYGHSRPQCEPDVWIVMSSLGFSYVIKYTYAHT